MDDEIKTDEIRRRLDRIYISGDVPMGSDAEMLGYALIEVMGVCRSLLERIERLEAHVGCETQPENQPPKPPF